MIEPYYTDDDVTLYLGKMQDVIQDLQLTADCIVADPPYGETSLAWDRWPDGWPAIAALAARSMWCFGSMRMFLDRRDEFGGWRLSQDVVWEKPNGTMMATDRFKRVHELVTHWYRGDWNAVHHETPREKHYGRDNGVRWRGTDRGAHLGAIRGRAYVDDGTRLLRSVQAVASMHKRGSHPTEKPVGILDPLIRYACPPGGTVLDPFAGSGSTAVAARLSGRKAVLIEAGEKYCEAIVNRLAQTVLEVG